MRYYFSALILIYVFAEIPSKSNSQSPPTISNRTIDYCKSNYSCGDNLKNIYFPFYGKYTPEICGHPGFELECIGNEDYSIISFDSLAFRVLNIDQNNRTMTLARNDLYENPCSIPTKKNTTISLNNPFFHNSPKIVDQLTLIYDCSDIGEKARNFNCSSSNDNRVYYVNDSGLSSLSDVIDENKECLNGIVQVPVSRETMDQILRGELGVKEGLKRGFQVKYMDLELCYKCMGSNGSCGFDKNAEFMCSCPRGLKEYEGSCVHISHGWNWKLKAAIGIGSGIGGIAIMCAVFYCFFWHKKLRESRSTLLSRNISSEISSSMNDAEKGGSTYGGIRVFNYEELVDATNNFDPSKELGDGGFGTVYYGKLKDGRTVAVKRLYENNYRRVEQFMNEVEILALVRHQNLVSLYGCTSRHCRELLLVYEFVPNGTVADHLHGPRARPGGLPWPARLSVALDTAAALDYLHRSEIVHRDVKTTNILLDSHFRVKVADFGLSRLFPTHVTHVSTAPQGTPGYVDPEYHQCYQLTSKSDVFSFGVVLVELISSMPAVDITRHRHDINLSTMALNRIQNHTLHELVDPSLGFDDDPQVQRAVTAVAELAFRCLQQEKDMRPSMEEVWDELKAIQERTNENVVVVASPDDAAVLLKKGSLRLSPDSVTLSWGSSRTTTPNASH